MMPSDAKLHIVLLFDHELRLASKALNTARESAKNKRMSNTEKARLYLDALTLCYRSLGLIAKNPGAPVTVVDVRGK